MGAGRALRAARHLLGPVPDHREPDGGRRGPDPGGGRAHGRLGGLVGIASLSAIAQLGGFHPPTLSHLAIFAVVACLNAVLVTVFIHLGQKAEDQNTERKRVIVDLAEANRQLETMMAENAGLHAQLLVQAREAGVLEERQRMAREIHDTLAQGLAGIITQLEAAQQAGLRALAEAPWG